MATAPAPSWRIPPFNIGEEEPFVEIVRSLCVYIEDVVEVPYTFEQLRTGNGALLLKPLIKYLTRSCTYPYLVSALLVLRYHYKDPDDRGVSEARALTCELLAWRVVLHCSRQDRLDALLTELPLKAQQSRAPSTRNEVENGDDEATSDNPRETSPLLCKPHPDRSSSGDASFIRQFSINQMRHLTDEVPDNHDEEDDPTSPFIGLNALEIAAIAEAKTFLSQRVVQKSVNAIWNGDVMFWDSVSLHAQRKACFYSKARADPYCRLRVPKYQKTFETAFYIGLLVLYYVVMQEDNSKRVTVAEGFLYIWTAAFAYEELGAFLDTGCRFYTTDLWNMMDIGIVLIAIAFAITRTIGLARDDGRTTDIAFDILSLMAVPLLPRTCSLLSLHPYFGILIPSLSQMCKDLIKFLVIVLVLYLGFASTFVLLARNAFSAKQIFWLLIYVFNGSGYMGLDVADQISRALGPTLMVVFVCITNILLLPTLISLLTNSLTLVMGNAREEFLFQYSILVLESCASKRLTYYFPPLNLIPLILFRPLRLFLPAGQVRSARIVLLKITHAPFVALLLLYEHLAGQLQHDPERWRSRPAGSKALGVARRHARSETFLDGRLGHGLTGRGEIDDGDSAGSVNELKDLVGRLAAQVERLEQRLEAQV